MSGPLKNARHEAFATKVVSGKSLADAYRDVYPKSRKWKDSALHPKASRLKDKVQARIDELTNAAADAAVASLNEVLRYLTEVIRAAPGQITEDSHLAQDFIVKNGINESSVTIRIPSKLDAVDKLAKILNWYAPVKSDTEHHFAPDSDVYRALMTGPDGVRKG